MNPETSTSRLTADSTPPQLPFPDVFTTSIPLAPYPIPTSTFAAQRPHASTSAALRRPQPQSRPSTVGIRRLPSAQRVAHITIQTPGAEHIVEEDEAMGGARRRSTSAPQPATRLNGNSDASRRANRSSHMQSVDEDPDAQVPRPLLRSRPTWFNRRVPSESATSTLGLAHETNKDNAPKRLTRLRSHEYNTNIVDFLDVVDPEVATLSTLNNVQNSLFVPDLGRWLNRRPTYELSPRDAGIPESNRKTIGTMKKRVKTDPIEKEEDTEGLNHILNQQSRPRRDSLESLHTINSRLSDSRFAVLPHGLTLDDWSEHDKAELNDHVRHLLHSRREKFKRTMKGFKKYVSKPLGFFVTVYAFCITIFGLFWVLFLIGWIGGGSRHAYFINVIDNVLVALFAVIGDGLAPFRMIDTYHMAFIARYARLEWKLREKRNLPSLPNPNDLPTSPSVATDLEAGPFPDTHSKDSSEPSLLLTPLQQKRLAHHQAKFSKSHTFYKPHETVTHHAFSIKLLIAIVALLDGHSMFQIALGACTWGISYHVRPGALTPVILVCSITCNTLAGVLISVGDKRSRKKEVIERMFRQTLTEEALEKMKERRGIEPVRAADDKEEEEEEEESASGETSLDGKRSKEVARGREESAKREVERETTGGVRDFAIRAAAVE